MSAMDDAWTAARSALLEAIQVNAKRAAEGDWVPEETARLAGATKDLAESYAWLTSANQAH